MSEGKNFEQVKIEKVPEGNYAVISINRPNKLNALAVSTLKELEEAFATVEIDKSVRCVVLRGTKEFTKKPAFSAGADLAAFNAPGLDMKNLRHQYYRNAVRHIAYDIIEDFPKPVIAAVDGFALGGGFELVLVCDIVIASKRSAFGFPEIKRGIFPANGGTQRLIENLGKFRVKNMIYFGDHYTAEQMHEWGIVSYLVDDGMFEDVINEKASLLGSLPTNSLFIIKKCINFGTQVPLNIGLQFEKFGSALNRSSKDVQEGINAFLEKRKPQFTGD